ncbi:MAG TPA: hypothetical protein VMV59_08245 [Candidatus Dormibacteraeota bacterium]|nr:hypothetical protein [Candidatus Dormibacteraeota bacterium]
MKQTSNREEARLHLKAPHWRKLRKGVWKTDLGGDRPEVVILILSNAEFSKFHASTKAAKGYIDKHHFLKRKLIKVVFANQSPRDNGGDWTVIISHTIQSTAGVIAYQG